MGYQDFCKRFEGVCQDYGTSEANRMFDDDSYAGCFGPDEADETIDIDAVPWECRGCDGDCNVCRCNERDV
jgi:hypothetical protein